jgi:hypothetical protein
MHVALIETFKPLSPKASFRDRDGDVAVAEFIAEPGEDGKNPVIQ